MKIEYVPVKNQKFEIGRTINPFKCDCKECTFMDCPKHNYAVKMTRKKYSIDDFWNEYKVEILKLNKPKKWQYNFHGKYEFLLTDELLNEFFYILSFTFPKGTYWQNTSPNIFTTNTGVTSYREISLVKFAKNGSEVTLGSVNITNPTIYDYDLNERQYKLAEKICDNIKRLKEKVFEYYQEQDKDWKVGWLAPDGRHYPCKWGEHSTLALNIGGGEVHLEQEGWVKVALEQEDGYFMSRRFPSAEQRNWLSTHGYFLED